MGSVLDLLNKVLKPGQIAAISLTGLISAFAVALLLWPPSPIDAIHIPAKDQVEDINVPKDCEYHEDRLNQARDPGDFKTTAIENQKTLDTAQENVQRCVDLLNSEVGEEATRDKQLTDQITVLRVAQTSAQANYLSYQKAGSPLEGQFLHDFKKDTDQIRTLQDEIVKNEKKIREQGLRIATYTHFLDLIKQRLLDAGRLRPTHSFDDVLQGLANHVVAFLGLAVVIGSAFLPLQSVFLGAFDYLLKRN